MQTLPQAFLERIQQDWSKDQYDSFMASFQDQPISIRIAVKKDVQHHLKHPVPWYSDAFYLPTRPSFTWDPAFQAGQYYVQEAGSMLIAQVFKLWRNSYTSDAITVLDACAAPGGKSTHLLDLLSEDKDVLMSNEPHAKRNATLRHNLGKWGYGNTLVTQADFEKDAYFPDHLFDAILVDAPCSGEGMFRKDPVAISEWSQDNVQQCAIRQKEILQNLLPLVKPQGLFIYSTCTFNSNENEDLVHALFEEGFTQIKIETPSKWGVTSGENGLGYRCIPGITQSEGFYLSAWVKLGTPSPTRTYKKRKSNYTIAPPSDLHPNSYGDYLLFGDSVHWASNAAIQFFYQVSGHVHCKKLGLHVGNVKGKNFIPTTELAQSVSLVRDYPSYSMTEAETKLFLQGNSFACAQPKGVYQMEFMGFALGFAKAVGKRWNNLRDKKERLISQPPEQIVSVLLHPT